MTYTAYGSGGGGAYLDFDHERVYYVAEPTGAAEGDLAVFVCFRGGTTETWTCENNWQVHTFDTGVGIVFDIFSKELEAGDIGNAVDLTVATSAAGFFADGTSFIEYMAVNGGTGLAEDWTEDTFTGSSNPLVGTVGDYEVTVGFDAIFHVDPFYVSFMYNLYRDGMLFGLVMGQPSNAPGWTGNITADASSVEPMYTDGIDLIEGFTASTSGSEGEVRFTGFFYEVAAAPGQTLGGLDLRLRRAKVDALPYQLHTRMLGE